MHLLVVLLSTENLNHRTFIVKLGKLIFDFSAGTGAYYLGFILLMATFDKSFEFGTIIKRHIFDTMHFMIVIEKVKPVFNKR